MYVCIVDLKSHNVFVVSYKFSTSNTGSKMSLNFLKPMSASYISKCYHIS